MAGFKPNSRHEFSMKWAYATGRPYTPIDVPASIAAGGPRYDNSLFHALMYPAYHKLNLRYDRRFHLDTMNIVTYFALQNLYNKKNVLLYFWDEDDEIVETEYQWALLPILGFSLEF